MRITVCGLLLCLALGPVGLWAESEIGGEYKTRGGNVITEDVGNIKLQSPDRTLILKHQVIQGKGDRKDDHESRVFVLDSAGNTLAHLDLTSSDSEHGHVVERIGWSPDSKFAVLSTYSSGGHSAWHFMTFFYSAELGCFGRLDDFLGHPVVDPNFSIHAPALIGIEVMGKDYEERVGTKFDLQRIAGGKAMKDAQAVKWMKTGPQTQCGF